MSGPAISIRDLGKRYWLGGGQSHDTLRDHLTHGTRALFRRFAGRNGASGDGSDSGEFWALRDVSFDIAEGDVLGVIGRNGAGKSTLLRILSQITEPTRGEVAIRGRVASLMEVGTGFHPELSGRENIYLNGAILGMSKVEIRRKFDEIVAFADVERFLDTPVKRYSSGMYMRLAFAVAAHLEPEILIVDEVLAVGDAEFQKKCIGKMDDVASGGRTVIFVSHNISAVRTLCRTACWLEKGCMKQFGETMPVTDQYLASGFTQSRQIANLSSIKRHAHFGSKLLIEEFEWTVEPPFVHDAPLGAAITFTALDDVEDLSLGVGFSTLDGMRLLTYESDLYGPRPRFSRGQRGVVNLRIDHLPLAPAVYSVDIGARSGNSLGVDYLAGATQIEVTTGPRTPGNLTSAGAGVRIPATWHWADKTQ